MTHQMLTCRSIGNGKNNHVVIVYELTNTANQLGIRARNGGLMDCEFCRNLPSHPQKRSKRKPLL